ncbi:MAG: hypothetical protein ACRDJT_08925 [Actinomycetota bacterium]
MAAVLAVAVFTPRRWRRAVLLVAATIGSASGVALAVAATGDEAVWRSTTLVQPRGVIAGAAVACAWLLAGALGSDRTLGSAALVGLASSGVLLATLNDWVVPALVLWLASSVALVALVSQARLRVGALLAIGLSDLALVGALALYSLDERVWTMPESLEGLPLGLALASLVIRSGAVPLAGVWETLDSPATPTLPLFLGGPLALLGVPLSGSGPWVAVAALVVALGLCGVALTLSELRLPLLGSWSVWLILGLLVAGPPVLQPAALAGLFAVTTVALWTTTRGVARAAVGLLVGFVPPTVGWVAIVATAVVAFDRAAGRSVAWALIAGLLPLTVAAGVALAARLVRQGALNSSEVRPAAAVSALFITGLCLGLAPPSVLGLARHTLGDFGRVLALNGAVLMLALVAGAVTFIRATGTAESVTPDLQAPAAPAYSEDRAHTPVLVGVFALLALGTVAVVIYLAFEGLSYGFLPSNL